MSRILGVEHDDCINWSNWCRWVELGIGYPNRWAGPDGPDLHVEENKDVRQTDEYSTKYDVHRALATDGYFRVWLDECRLHGRCWGKRQFIILRGTYLLHRTHDELTVREALRALADLKTAQLRGLERPRLAAVA